MGNCNASIAVQGTQGLSTSDYIDLTIASAGQAAVWKYARDITIRTDNPRGKEGEV